MGGFPVARVGSTPVLPAAEFVVALALALEVVAAARKPAAVRVWAGQEPAG